MEDQRNQAIGMLRAGSMVNNIAYHFGRSRQTIHNLVNRLLGQPGTVQDLVAHVRQRYVLVALSRLLSYVIILTSNHYCLAVSGFMYKRSFIVSCKITEHDNACLTKCV